MELTSLCVLLSTLRVTPNKSQFFRYEAISLTCVTPANSGGWSVVRNTSLSKSEACGADWGLMANTSCNIENAYGSDTREYWCESPQGGCSNKVNIIVTAAAVIMESPALPVTEGDTVTLRCAFSEVEQYVITSNFSASFYKDDVLIRNESAGRMILPAVSKADEGFYKCQHPVSGTSPQSLLAVKVRVQSTGPPQLTPYRLMGIILTVVLFTIFTLFVYLYRHWSPADERRR